jgi:hypothetical protein
MPLAADEAQAGDNLPNMNEFIKKYAEIFTRDYVNSSKGQLKALESEPVDVIDTRLNEWEERRPGKVAANESISCSNAIAKAVFIAAGITKLIWVSQGSASCPFCQKLDGQIVGTEGKFGVTGLASTNHPPIHEGCICSISPQR